VQFAVAFPRSRPTHFKVQSIISEPADYLLTEVAKVFGLPGELPHPPDPVGWALDMFAASLPEADMQSREAVDGK